MPISDGLLQELTMEAARTRALLERLPEDKLDWKPHDKSMPLGVSYPRNTRQGRGRI